MAVSLLLVTSQLVSAQTSLSWDQVKAKFEAVNPAFKADAINVDEMKAEEITAFLRPNPQYTLATDGTQVAPAQWRLAAPGRDAAPEQLQLSA